MTHEDKQLYILWFALGMILAGAIGYTLARKIDRPILTQGGIPDSSLQADPYEGWEKQYKNRIPSLPEGHEELISPDDIISIEQEKLSKRCNELITRINNEIKQNINDSSAQVEVYSHDRDLAMEAVLAEYKRKGWDIKFKKEGYYRRYTRACLVFTR